MSGIQTEAAMILAPTLGRICVTTMTTTTLITTLTATAHLGPAALNNGKYVTVHADGGDLYLMFASTSSATGSTFDTSVSGNTRAWKIPDGEERSFYVGTGAGGKLFSKIHHLASAAGKLRAYVSSARTSNPGGNSTP